MLDFSRVSEVSKTRQIYRLRRAGYEIELSIDSVENLGSFVELETVVDESSELDTARSAINELASELKLSESERRSYLELLLEQGGN